ncbi:MAG: exo-alpha-sialidase [Gammaproteobacteria bacterium]|nr:exo-alpha-sialidase [Gammaproteobacteria bacterium]
MNRITHGHGRWLAGGAALMLLGSCGGNGNGTILGGGGGGGGGPPAFTSVPQVRVSQAPSLPANCDGVAASGTLYSGTAAEPFLVVNPNSNLNLIAAWQQNRWSTGGAQAIGIATSMDGGMTWTHTAAAFSRCSGGSSSNAGNYARATDVWLSAGPSGVIWALALAFTGDTLAAGSSSAMLVAHSNDGGSTWSLPTALIQDGATVFNDKGSITADPVNGSLVYATWDRLTSQTAGPSYFASTSDGGVTWQPARAIYDPGSNNQTIGNQILVLPSGRLLDVFTQIDAGNTASVQLLQSIDQGASWSAPVQVAALHAVGTTDPHGGAVVRDGSDLVSAAVSPSGVVYLVWQESSFSNGVRDGIALSSSQDGGATWSTPIEVNGDPAVQAFTPTVAVRADGTIGVTYYDLRNAAASSSKLLADCWLVTSSDGTTFKETHLSGPFDLRLAPNSEGLFLGDYESLASNSSGFLPFYVQTNPGSTVSSDAFIDFPPAGALADAAQSYAGRPAATGVLDAAARQRVAARLAALRAQRLTRR